MELVVLKEFVTITFDLEDVNVIFHIASLTSFNIYPSFWTQIAFLISNKTPITVLIKYSDFGNIFSPKLVIKLIKYIGINNNTIE